MREKRVQVDRLMVTRKRISEKQKPVIGSSGIQDPVKDRRDHQGDEAFPESDQRKAHNAQSQPHFIRLDIPQ
jgi:hypothetical protein